MRYLTRKVDECVHVCAQETEDDNDRKDTCMRYLKMSIFGIKFAFSEIEQKKLETFYKIERSF